MSVYVYETHTCTHTHTYSLEEALWKAILELLSNKLLTGPRLIGEPHSPTTNTKSNEKMWKTDDNESEVRYGILGSGTFWFHVTLAL